MRTFQRTHPWIRFRIDLWQAGPSLWMLLGEAASKCEHIAGVPLRPSVARTLHQLYLAKGVLATTAIEGNTLTEKEVLAHLEGKLRLPPSKEYLAQEVDNIIGACNRLRDRLQAGDTALTVERIREFNRQVLDKLALAENVVPGEIRGHSVLVGNVYRGAPVQDCQFLLQRLCEWLAGEDFAAPKGMETVYAIIKAVVAHLYLAWIHPFGDGNGRTARLIGLQILPEYYRQLDCASKSGGEVVPFIQYAAAGFVDGLREQLNVIREQQWDVAWRSYVHEKFRDQPGAIAKRQRDLVLELSATRDPVPIGRITDLTPRLAKAYAGISAKTLRRDLAAAEKLGLIERKTQGVRAKREVILAFLPWRQPGGPVEAMPNQASKL